MRHTNPSLSTTVHKSINFARQFIVRLLFITLLLPAWNLNRASSVKAATREPVRARHGMVASTSGLASQVGVDVLRRGGNAVDAAIAVAFALAVTYPAAGNLGGGGFMMIRLKDGTTTAIDYRETAPAKATRNIYLDANGNLIEGEGGSLIGYRAVGVPGTVAGMELALKKYGSGKISWADLIEPARKLAGEGFQIRYALARSLKNSGDLLGRYRDSKRILLNDGKFYEEGETLRQTDLAATFARLQKGGAKEFYTGETARLIVRDMEANKGLITLADMQNYVAKERVPLRTTYRGHEIISMPPPSSGGAVLIEMLNILEAYDLPTMNPFASERYHLIVEAMRRAFADRAEYMGDTDFVDVPIAELITKSYAAKQRRSINEAKASTSTEIKAGNPTAAESDDTTHFTVIDEAGNVVTNTYTLNNTFGAGVMARGTGILLNDEMDDFAAKPGTPNLYGLIQGEKNVVAPGKRPLSAMTPTIVMQTGEQGGGVWFAVGSPGGPTIINTVLQVVLNVIDCGMDMQEAVDAPRIHHQWLPDEITYEPLGMSADTLRALAARGHRFVERPRYMGDAQAIMIEPKTGMRLGASDGRNDGQTVGY